MKKTRFSSIIIFLLLAFFSFSGYAGDVKEGQVVETMLDNGLKVLTVEMHNAPIIFSQLAYKVGSRNENIGLTGLAHITEHMMFKGTPTYPKGKIARLIKDNAGIFNAFTSNDITAYYEQMPKNKIDFALAIEADRMFNCLIDAGELKKELEVIKEERRMRTDDNPRGIFREEFNAIAFKSSPNHWPIIGWMNDIKKTTRDNVWNFYRTYYTPNNATLVLVGDFETETMLAKVRKYFGSIPRGPEVPLRKVHEPEQTSKRTVTVKRVDVKTVTVTMAWHTPAMGHPDNAALRVLARVLGGGRTSRLYKNLVEEKKLAIRASTRVRLAKDSWLFTVSVELKREDIDKTPTVENIILAEIKKIKQEGITEYELQKIKNHLRHSEIFENMKVSSVGMRLARYETYVSWQFYDQWKEQQKAVTLADVKRVANEYFNPDWVTVGYLLPENNNTESETQASLLTPQNILDVEKCYYLPLSEPFFMPEEIDVIKPRPIEPRIEMGKLANGIPVYFIHDKAFPIFSIRGFIRTGNCPEDKEKPGVGMLTGRMMNRGTKKHTNDFLNERMDFVPFSFKISGGVERVRFSGGTITEYADSLLKYGFEILTEPAFPEDGFTVVRNNLISSIRKANAGKGWKTGRFIFENIYGKDHPYGRLVSGSEENVNKLTVNDLGEFHSKYYYPQHTVLCVLSNLTLEQAIAKLNKTFGKWTHPNPPELTLFPEPKPLTGRTVKTYPMPEKKQADVRIGGTLAPYGHPDTEAIDIAVHILGGSSLSSRMGVSIRDEQGLAYGVGVKTRQRNKGGLWFMKAGTKGENAQKLLHSAIKEIDKMRQEEVTDEELLTAKRYFIGTLPMVIETPLDILHQVAEMVRHEAPLNEFDTYADRVMRVTKQDVLRVMKKYFNPKNIVIVGAGPLKEDALEEFEK